MLLNEKGDLYDCEALGGVDAPDRPFLCFIVLNPIQTQSLTKM